MAMTRRAVVSANDWAAELQNVAGFPRAVLTFDNLADYNDSHAVDVPRASILVPVSQDWSSGVQNAIDRRAN
ncbi:hypothetical protein R75465_06529 [Paraburkholderia aspalathi]|nr:hypothetical protein R75465_06529 [Paraburkholderia aspalathi]